MHPIYPTAIHDLIQALRKLPSIGHRSAEKLAFAILEWPEYELKNFCNTLIVSQQAVVSCNLCGCLYDNHSKCWSCASSKRHMICIVAHPREAFAIQATAVFQGLFHVLGGLLDPMHDIEPDDLNFQNLVNRLIDEPVQEVLIALDATLEGDATSLYLKQQIEHWVSPKQPQIKISRLAFGMPMNSPLELVDPATLSRAISSKSYW
jgi:recombination protein RecR